MTVAFDTVSSEQRNGRGRWFGKPVVGAAPDRDDPRRAQGCLARIFNVNPAGAAVSTWSGWYMSM
jgi:hypothetical protein